MRRCVLFVALFVETLAMGQGFNERLDALGLGLQQTGFGVERAPGGWTIISGSDDRDSIGPGVWFYHASTVLRHIDMLGNTLWEKRAWRAWHGTLPGWSNCCDTIPGGGYVVGGASEDTTGFDEVYLMRFDANGDTLWTRVFGDPNGILFWIGQQVKRTFDSGFLIVGFTEQGNWDGFALKTDSAGNELWRSTYGWSGLYSDGLASVSLSSTGDLFMCGSRFFPDGTGDNWLQRTDSQGVLRWRTSWGGPYTEGGCNVETSTDGNALIFSGKGYAPSYTAMRPYIAKLDSSDGSIIWERDYGPTKPFTQFAAGKETPVGNIIAAGLTYEQPGPSVAKGVMALVSSTGDSLWYYTYFYQDDSLADGTGRFYDVLPTADGGFIAAGAAYFSASGNNPQGISQDTWVVKVDSLGCIVPGCNNVGVTEQATNLLDALTVYPNPASEQVTLRLELPPNVAQHNLQLRLIAMDGRIVLQRALPGNGTHPLPLVGLAAGLYHVHITDGAKWLTGGKLVIE